MFSIHEIIDIAVKLEKNSEKIYRKARKRTADIALKDLLEWIVTEELSHADWLAALKSDIEQNKGHPLIKEMSETLVKDFVGEQAFSLQDVDFAKIKNAEALIQIFIDFEKDTIIFYEMLKSFITDKKTIEKVNQIIAQEKVHIEKFLELLPDVPDENGSA